MTDPFFYLVMLALAALALAAVLQHIYLRSYRKGFRAAIDFMDGRRDLPPEIYNWRKALD